MSTKLRTISIAIIFLTIIVAVPPDFPPLVRGYTEISTPVGTVVWGALSFDKTWTKSSSPYIIEGYVTVNTGATLTIEASVTVRVNKSLSGGEFYVEGSLVVSGREDAPVIITSNQTTPAFDDWGNIWINSTAHTEMNWTEMWFGHGFGIVSGGNFIRNSKFMEISTGVNVVGAGNLLDRVEVSQRFLAPAIHAMGANNIITNCTFRDNTIGILLDFGASGSVIVNNTFKNNSNYGLGIRQSLTNIKVYHNNFIDNDRQAVALEANALYNDTYPSGGNFWSDYTGADDCSGPNQDVCPDPDGIGDTPYPIPHVSTGVPVAWDYYPLMCPTWGCILAPATPTNLSADLSGNGFENVTISWDLSVDDNDGQKSVVRYDILRGSSYSSNLSGYVLHDSVPSGTSLFEDVGAGEGDSNNYFYTVCAVDFLGNVTCSTEQVAKFTKSLVEGMNLVSIPLELSDQNATSVLQTVSFDKAWSYDCAGKEWKWLVKSKPYPGSLQRVDRTMGLWVNVTVPSNLTVAGIVPHNTSIQLIAGWNLVGFPSFNDTYSIGDMKAMVTALRIEGVDPSSSPYNLRMMADFEVLQAGQGYWVMVQFDMEWIVEF